MVKASDIMQKNVLTVTEETSLKKLARLMFSTHLAGYPVLRNSKVVGIVTADDIFMKAKAGLNGQGNKESGALKALFAKQVKDVMVSDVTCIDSDMPISQVHDLMVENYFARLPVVNEKNELLGIISYSDVFREIISKEIPELEMDEYVSFIIENYDELVDWEKRFDYEFPTLFRVFNKHNVKKVLDVGFWTGAYTMELAKEGLDNVVGVDLNQSLVTAANEKRDKLPEAIKKKVSFKLVDFKNLSKDFSQGSFDAAVCVGNAFAYIPGNSLDLLKSIHKIIRKDGVVVLQLLNMERVIERKKRFYYFRIKDSRKPNNEELFVEYYDIKGKDTLTQNIISFVSNGERWIYRGINSLDIKYIKNDEVEKMVKDAGFTDINITGNKGDEEGQYGPMSLIKPFDSETSDWMTVIAVKK